MNSRFLGMFVVVLVFGVMSGFGVTEVEAGCFEQVVSDTRECEHKWEVLDFPECMQVDVSYDFADSPFVLCEYQVNVKNNCSEVYELSFECSYGGVCGEEYVLFPDEVNDIVYSLVPFSDGRMAERDIPVLFRSVEKGDGSEFSGLKKKAGVLTSRLSGELVHGISPDCRDEGFFCQVTSAARPVGGFVGLVVGVLSLVGIVWRRWVVG